MSGAGQHDDHHYATTGGGGGGGGGGGNGDTWEHDGLYQRMRELKPPSHAPPAAPPYYDQGASQNHAAAVGSVGFVRSDASSSSFGDPQADAIAAARGYVDPMLREALTQGGTQRMAVLKIDVEVERFVKDRTQRTFEYDGTTSYHRLIAHKVAAHYGGDPVQVASR
jgi:hypothetical protein